MCNGHEAVATLAIVVLLVSGCATTTPSANVEEGSSAKDLAATEQCTRFTAAMRSYNKVFNPINMQKKAIEECGRGDGYACVSTPLVIPYTALFWVVGVPLLVPIVAANDHVYRSECPAARVDDTSLR